MLLIGDYLNENNFYAIQKLISGFHPADIAFLLNLLEDDDACKILNSLEDEVKTGTIPELNKAIKECGRLAFDKRYKRITLEPW
jgi:hypothetical protein